MTNSHLVEWFASAGPRPRIAIGIAQSGSGKSTEVAYLRSLDYAAFDLDTFALNAWHGEERNDRWSVQPALLKCLMHGSIVFGQSSNVLAALEQLSGEFEVGIFWFTRPVETLVEMLKRRITFNPNDWVGKAVTGENSETYSGMSFMERYGVSEVLDRFRVTFLGYYMLPGRAPFDEDSHSAASAESVGFPLWCTPHWVRLTLGAGHSVLSSSLRFRSLVKDSESCALLEDLAGSGTLPDNSQPLTVLYSFRMEDMGRLGSFVSWGKQPMSITLQQKSGFEAPRDAKQKGLSLEKAGRGFQARIPIARFAAHGVPPSSPLLEYAPMNDTEMLSHYASLQAHFPSLGKLASPKAKKNGK